MYNVTLPFTTFGIAHEIDFTMNCELLKHLKNRGILTNNFLQNDDFFICPIHLDILKFI